MNLTYLPAHKKVNLGEDNDFDSTASWAIEMVQKQPITLGLVSKFINESSKLDFTSQEMQEKINA